MCESEQERLLVSICGLIFKAVSVGEFGPSIGFEREKKNWSSHSTTAVRLHHV